MFGGGEALGKVVKGSVPLFLTFIQGSTESRPTTWPSARTGSRGRSPHHLARPARTLVGRCCCAAPILGLTSRSALPVLVHAGGVGVGAGVVVGVVVGGGVGGGVAGTASAT